ncbi:flavoprotein [Nocardiopsis sp. NPDC058789]|uniref:flavoprotein n=1 Tax=Nocardiopsis sp. NPDC058789 TaxID=3346634 RepID=UPI003671FEAD
MTATPSAIAFIDVERPEKQIGRPVRSTHREPGEPRSPKADAIIIALATFNTINKLASGIADNYVLDVVNEAIDIDVPTVILPFVNSAYANRAPFRESARKLRAEEISVLIGLGRSSLTKPVAKPARSIPSLGNLLSAKLRRASYPARPECGPATDEQR